MSNSASTGSLDLPILIYASLKGCWACQKFEEEWKKICQQLENQVRLVRFNCERTLAIPGPLKKYFGWYPSIILVGPKSYFRCFTPDDQLNLEEYSEDYLIRGIKFNAIPTSDGYNFAGIENTAENVINWFKRIRPTLESIDEKTPPKKYAQFFGKSK